MAKSKWPDVKEIISEEQRFFFIGKEKEYEQYIADNLAEICEGIGLPEIKEIKRQPRSNVGSFSIKPDILVVHIDDTASIFEIKCVDSKYPSSAVSEQCRAIGQMLLYKNVYKEMNGASPRMFLVDQKIHKRTMCVFADLKLPITLIEVQGGRVFIPYKHHED